MFWLVWRTRYIADHWRNQTNVNKPKFYSVYTREKNSSTYLALFNACQHTFYVTITQFVLLIYCIFILIHSYDIQNIFSVVFDSASQPVLRSSRLTAVCHRLTEEYSITVLYILTEWPCCTNLCKPFSRWQLVLNRNRGRGLGRRQHPLPCLILMCLWGCVFVARWASVHAPMFVYTRCDSTRDVVVCLLCVLHYCSM